MRALGWKNIIRLSSERLGSHKTHQLIGYRRASGVDVLDLEVEGIPHVSRPRPHQAALFTWLVIPVDDTFDWRSEESPVPFVAAV